MPKTRVVLADDHDVVIHGLKALLHEEAGLDVIAHATEGLTALQLVERLQPDVLVVDMMMPGVNGLEIARQVSRRHPSVKVVMLSMHDNEAYVSEALKAGVMAYVLKAADAGELIMAIREATAGRRYLSRELSERAIAAYVERCREADDLTPPDLTEREREVLQLVAEGRSMMQIATALGISPRTAETHRGNMTRKLGLKTQTDVIRYAIQHGVISVS